MIRAPHTYPLGDATYADLLDMTAEGWDRRLDREASQLREDQRYLSGLADATHRPVRFFADRPWPWGWVDVAVTLDGFSGGISPVAIGLVAPSMSKSSARNAAKCHEVSRYTRLRLTTLGGLAGGAGTVVPVGLAFSPAAALLGAAAAGGLGLGAAAGEWVDRRRRRGKTQSVRIAADDELYPFVLRVMTRCVFVVQALRDYDTEMAAEASRIGVQPEPLIDAIREVPAGIRTALWDSLRAHPTAEDIGQVDEQVTEVLSRVSVAIDAAWQRLDSYAPPEPDDDDRQGAVAAPVPRPNPVDQLRALTTRIEQDTSAHERTTQDVRALNRYPDSPHRQEPQP